MADRRLSYSRQKTPRAYAARAAAALRTGDLAAWTERPPQASEPRTASNAKGMDPHRY
jgi:hypothetical protein